MQEHLQPHVHDSPFSLSEGEIVSPLTEQQDNGVVTSTESEFIAIILNIHT